MRYRYRKYDRTPKAHRPTGIPTVAPTIIGVLLLLLLLLVDWVGDVEVAVSKKAGSVVGE